MTNILGDERIAIVYVKVDQLKAADYNPRRISGESFRQLTESVRRFGLADPIIVNRAPTRENIVIGGHMRLRAAKELGFGEVPVVYVNIPDLEKEKELNLRLNRNQGEFDINLLTAYDESFLNDVGFTSEELDTIFEEDSTPEIFNLEEELEKLNIGKIAAKKGDIYDLDGSRLMVGDSTIEADMLALMGGEKADMVLTDQPYRLNYLQGKTRHGEATVGFGTKRNRRYLETESLPTDFVELWMGNVAKVQAGNFSIISFENWKNIREQWGVMEKHWHVRNMIVWHIPTRNQGYTGKYKLFSKHDIAMLGTSEEYIPHLEAEETDELIENEYRSALFATAGKPGWEGYKKGNKYCPTDFIEFNAADEKSSGQAIIFGVKPVEILLPYIKILTKRGQLVLEPFGGSGSTLIASNILGRRCFVMEKSPAYAEVIMHRWETKTGKKRVKIHGTE